MQHVDENDPQTGKSSLREAVLDLMADAGAGDERQFRAALREVVAGAWSPAEDLWHKYRRDRVDIRDGIFARYGY
jgi:hypothetical protein